MDKGEPPVERVLGGRYRLLAEIGSGGFGRVWRAHDQHLDVIVAVKEVSLPGLLPEGEATERLARAGREARNAARLRDHPNIVAVHDVLTEDGRPWIVMRHVDGVSLADRLTTDGPLDFARAKAVAEGLLSALRAAHAAGVVHRDVKPGNVLLAEDGTALLADFGIAAHRDDTAMTRTGMVVGSLEYLAPERMDGDDGPQGDLWSLGVTLYQAVTGKSPFRRDSTRETVAAVLASTPEPPQPPDSPLSGVIMGLLAKDPARRFTPEQALRGLADTAEPLAPTKVETKPVRQDPVTRHLETAPSRWRKYWLPIALVALVAAVVAVAVRANWDTASGSHATDPSTTAPSTTPAPATTTSSSKPPEPPHLGLVADAQVADCIEVFAAIPDDTPIIPCSAEVPPPYEKYRVTKRLEHVNGYSVDLCGYTVAHFPEGQTHGPFDVLLCFTRHG